MEMIVQVNEGSKPNVKRKCFFCDSDSKHTFGIIKDNKTILSNNNEAYIMTAVGLCDIHAEGINSLLSGEHDINDLINVMRTSKQKKLNLRR